MKSVALAAAGCLFASAVVAEERGDPNRGRSVVMEWCAMCHSISGIEKDPDRAPTFETISRRPGRHLEYYQKFLDEDHFPMTTFRRFDGEKRDVAAFLADLGQR